VLEAITKAENIQVSDEEFEAELAKMAEAYKMEVAQIKEFMGEKEATQMRDDVAIQKAVDFVVENAVEK
jgi:trigger factor